jgi:hypothetical protein
MQSDESQKCYFQIFRWIDYGKWLLDLGNSPPEMDEVINVDFAFIFSSLPSITSVDRLIHTLHACGEDDTGSVSD